MKLEVHETGTGDDVAVLIHGFNCDAGDWWELTPRLIKKGYRVQALDLRGHGLSPRADSYRIEDYAADVIETVSPNPALIMGHSLGARVTGAIVGDLKPGKAIYLDPPWSEPDATVENLFPDLDSIAAMSDQELASTLRHDFPAWSERAIEVDVASWRRWDPATATLLKEPRLREMPEEAVVPSLAIAAELDTVFRREDYAEARRRGFEVRLAPGLTHSLFRDDFELFYSLVDDWL